MVFKNQSLFAGLFDAEESGIALRGGANIGQRTR